MKKEEIYFGDWKRLLLGNAPLKFLAEALIRTIIMYAILLLVLRVLGKRINVRLTITELAVIFTLGTIVSAPRWRKHNHNRLINARCWRKRPLVPSEWTTFPSNTPFFPSHSPNKTFPAAIQEL